MTRYFREVVVRGDTAPADYPATAMTPEQIATCGRLLMGGSPVEIAAALLMDRDGRLVGIRELGRGTALFCGVDILRLVRALAATNAHFCALVHNHPLEYGSPVASLSAEDRQLTWRVAAVCQILDTRLVDHVVINGAGTEWASFRQHHPSDLAVTLQLVQELGALVAEIGAELTRG